MSDQAFRAVVEQEIADITALWREAVGESAADKKRIADLEAEVKRLRAELDLAAGLLRDRNRMEWNPSGYWIDGTLRGDTIHQAIQVAAKATEGK